MSVTVVAATIVIVIQVLVIVEVEPFDKQGYFSVPEFENGLEMPSSGWLKYKQHK